MFSWQHVAEDEQCYPPGTVRPPQAPSRAAASVISLSGLARSHPTKQKAKNCFSCFIYKGPALGSLPSQNPQWGHSRATSCLKDFECVYPQSWGPQEK